MFTNTGRGNELEGPGLGQQESGSWRRYRTLKDESVQVFKVSRRGSVVTFPGHQRPRENFQPWRFRLRSRGPNQVPAVIRVCRRQKRGRKGRVTSQATVEVYTKAERA